MTDFLSPERTHSVVFRPNGIYYGTVVQVDEVNRRVWVTLPRITSSNATFGGTNGCPVAGSTLPVVGDTVACVWAENRTEQLIVLGTLQDDQTRLYAPTVIATSTTRPAADGLTLGTLLYETDTGVIRIWDGTGWRGLRTGSGSSAGAVYFDEAGVGVGSPTSGQPLSVTKTIVFPAALNNASSGVAQFGAVTGANLLFDRDLIQARNNGSAATLRLNPLGGFVSGSFNAADLTRGTVPAARLSGVYPNLTGVGALAELTVSGATLFSGAATVGTTLTFNPATGTKTYQLLNEGGILKLRCGADEVLATNFDTFGPNVTVGTNGFSLGTWSAAGVSAYTGAMQVHTDGKRYYLLMARSADLHTYVGARPGGFVYVRPDNNDATRQLVLTASGDWNGIAGTTDTGHVIYGRLTFRSDGTYTSGAWFTSNNGTASGLFGYNNAENKIGYYNKATNNWPMLFDGSTGNLQIGVDGGGITYRGVPTIPNVGSPLYVNGFTGVVSIQGSNRRLKDNIVDLGNALDVVGQLRPRTYTIKGSPVTDPHYGFIVEEVEEVSPHLVEYRPDDNGDPMPGMWHMEDFIALSVAAIKELKATVDELETRLAELEG
jgi:hypothetical protein